MFIQVGFDMAPIQIPLKCVDPSIAGRVQWVHGNLYVPCGSFSWSLVLKFQSSLKYPWPFPDDEFDYIHVEGVGLAIPETKVESLN